MAGVNKHYQYRVMNLIKKNWLLIAVVIPLLILVLIRSFGAGSFRNDAGKWAEPSMNRSNITDLSRMETVPGEKLLINLDSESGEIRMKQFTGLHLPPDSVLSKKYLSVIKGHKGPVLLLSSDPALAARIWMIISQTGCRNIFILVNNPDNEVFKYKFPADSQKVRNLEDQ
jgi:hypothetical protein